MDEQGQVPELHAAPEAAEGFNAGELKVKKASMQNLEVRVRARNGIIQLDPLKLDLYKGNIAGTGTVSVQKDKPATALDMVINGIQAGQLIKDVMVKELIEGALSAEIGLNFTGDAADLKCGTAPAPGAAR